MEIEPLHNKANKIVVILHIPTSERRKTFFPHVVILDHVLTLADARAARCTRTVTPENGIEHLTNIMPDHSKKVTRPTFLVAEPEPEQALSTRKLVLETAKFNVLTAHSGREFMELLQRFPKVDCAVVHPLTYDSSCEQMLAESKKFNPEIKTIFLSASVGERCRNADHVVSSHHPEALLELAHQLFGDPRDLSDQAQKAGT